MTSEHAHEHATAAATAHGRPKVVVGIDGSDQSKKALRLVADLARLLDLRVEAVFAYLAPAPYTPFISSAAAEVHTSAHDLLTAWVDEVFADVPGGVPADLTAVALPGDAPRVLMNRADKAEMLVVGSHGHGGIVGVLLGSVAVKCVAHNTCPVLIVRGESVAPRGRIVVGVDGSPSSKAALAWARRMSDATGEGIDAVITWEPPIMFGYPMAYVPLGWTPEHDYANYLDKYVGDVFGDDRPRDLHLIAEEGFADQRLLDRAEDASLLVLGSRGRGGFARLLLGSVSARCVHHAPCPVLVVPVGRETAAEKAPHTTSESGSAAEHSGSTAEHSGSTAEHSGSTAEQSGSTAEHAPLTAG